MRIFVTKNFEKALKKLPKDIQIKAKGKLKLFQENLKHPSLGLEKLEPKQRGMWSFRIDKQYRIIFTFLEENAIELRDARHHKDIYRKVK